MDDKKCAHVFKPDPDYGEQRIYFMLTGAEYTVELQTRIKELEEAPNEIDKATSYGDWDILVILRKFGYGT